jgi:ethanolamine transporter EutH
MEELLGRAIAWILDHTIPPLRDTLGNWGCFLFAILATALPLWILPTYIAYNQGGDWKAWLVVGSMATAALVIMVTVHFGLAQRSGPDEPDP